MIRDIVRAQRVPSQSALVRELARRGVRATQATVSRDVHALGLIKVPDNGGSCYVLPEQTPPTPMPAPTGGSSSALRRAFRDTVLGIGRPAAMLTLRTPSGFANAIAVALDQAALTEVVATLAGDDTVLVLLHSERDREKVAARFESWIE